MSNSLAGFGYDIGIEAEDGEHEGALPSLVTIAWEHTDDVKNLASFFTLTKGAVAVSEAQCITHKVIQTETDILVNCQKNERMKTFTVLQTLVLDENLRI